MYSEKTTATEEMMSWQRYDETYRGVFEEYDWDVEADEEDEDDDYLNVWGVTQAEFTMEDEGLADTYSTYDADDYDEQQGLYL